MSGEDMFGEEDLPAGGTSKDWSNDRFVGKEITFDNAPLSEFTESMSEDGGDGLSITRNGDEFVLDGSFDMSQEASDGFDPSEMMAGAELEVTFTFPGKVKESNGDESGRSVTWHPKVGEKNEMHAVAAAKGSFGDTLSDLVLPVGVGLGLLLLIGGLLYATKRTAASSTAAPTDLPTDTTPDTTDAPIDETTDTLTDTTTDSDSSGDSGGGSAD